MKCANCKKDRHLYRINPNDGRMGIFECGLCRHPSQYPPEWVRAISKIQDAWEEQNKVKIHNQTNGVS